MNDKYLQLDLGQIVKTVGENQSNFTRFFPN